MSQPLTVALPPGLDLWGDCEIQVTALNATTGAVVTGVQVSNVTLEVDQVAGPPLTPSGRVLLLRPG